MRLIDYFISFKKIISQKSLLKTGAKYSLWASIKSGCTTLVGLAVMYWLNPFELGQWNTVSIFLAYTPFFQLGIQSGLNIELPIQLGRNMKGNAELLIANGYGYAIIISCVLFLIGCILTIIMYFTTGIQIAAGAAGITLVAIASSFQLHFTARFRSAKAFDKLIRIYQLEIPVIVICVFLIYQYHYWGILLYNVLTYCFSVILLYIYAPFKSVKPRIRRPIIFRMGKIGIALMILVQLRTAAQTLPRWIIVAKGGVEKLGLYTPATAINNLISLIPGQIAQFFHPQMGYIYGKTGKAEPMWPYVKKMILLLPLAAFPAALCIYLLSPWLLYTFFPKYTESLDAMRIMAFTFVFSCSITTSWVLNTLKAFKYSYFFAICDFCGCFIYPYLSTLLFNDLPILTSVTIGLFINSIFSYILNYAILYRVLHLTKYN